MPEDPRDALALATARTDQTCAGVKDTATLLVVFRETLIAGRFPDELADSLTRDYFDALLERPYPEEGDE